MANLDWSNMGFKIQGNATSTLIDISSYVNSQSLAAAITMLDTTGMGAANRTRVNGLSDRSADINYFVNTTTEGVFGPLHNGTSIPKRAQFQVNTGRYFNGSVLPSNIQISGSPDTLEMGSVTLMFTGAVNRTSVGL